MTISTNDPVVDAASGAGYTVSSIPDEFVLLQEYDVGDRLRHVIWLRPAAACELGRRLLELGEKGLPT